MKMRWGERFIRGINEVLRKYMASPRGRERERRPIEPAEAGPKAAIDPRRGLVLTVASDYSLTRGFVG